MAIHVYRSPHSPDFANRADLETLPLHGLHRALRKKPAPPSRREEYR